MKNSTFDLGLRGINAFTRWDLSANIRTVIRILQLLVFKESRVSNCIFILIPISILGPCHTVKIFLQLPQRFLNKLESKAQLPSPYYY